MKYFVVDLEEIYNFKTKLGEFNLNEFEVGNKILNHPKIGV